MARSKNQRGRFGGRGFGGNAPAPKKQTPRQPTSAPGKGYVKLGDNRFRNTKPGSPRKGKVFRKVDGKHVYPGGVKVGGPKGPANKKSVQQPFDVTAPITDPKLLNREVSAQTRMQYQPQFAEIERQQGISRTHEANVGNWYQQIYLPQLQAAQAQSQQGYQQAQQAAYGQANSAAASDETQRQQMMQEAQASAAQRGAAVDPALFEQSRQGAAQRQAQGTSYGNLIGAQGAAQNAYHAQQPVIARAQELSFRQGEANRRFDLGNQRQDLVRERSLYKTKARGELIDRERKSVLEHQLFDLDVAKAQQDAADAAEDNRAARARLRATRRGQNVTKRGQNITRQGQIETDARAREKEQRIAAGEKDGGSTLSPADRRRYQADFGQALSIAGAYMKNGKLKKGFTPAEVVQGLVAKKGYPLPIARAAVERALRGHVSPGTARKLRKFGVRARVAPKKVKPKNVKIGPGGIPIINGRPTP